jgi:hypothetical protein
MNAPTKPPVVEATAKVLAVATPLKREESVSVRTFRFGQFNSLLLLIYRPAAQAAAATADKQPAAILLPPTLAMASATVANLKWS